MEAQEKIVLSDLIQQQQDGRGNRNNNNSNWHKQSIGKNGGGNRNCNNNVQNDGTDNSLRHNARIVEAGMPADAENH